MDPFTLAALIVGLILLASLSVVFFGAPYVPTHGSQLENLFDALPLQPGDTIVDLGSGDGTVLLRAARRGLRAVGYELNPALVLVSRWRCRAYVRSGAVRVVTRDFWRTDLPAETGVVFVFLAQPFMQRLADHMEKQAARLGRTVVLVSYGFALPGYEPFERVGPMMVYRITASKALDR